MKKIFKYGLLFFVFILFLIPNKASASNKVNIYLFYGNGCPHCADEKIFLDEMKAKYDNIIIHEYEVWYNTNNSNKMRQVADLLNFKVRGVPLTIVGDKIYSGYNDSTGEAMEEVIIKYSSTTYNDKVGKYLGVDVFNNVSSSGEKEDVDDDIVIDEKKEIDVPFIGKVSIKNLSLPILAILIGTIDGFNPCAMWILLFLISMLLGMKNKKRMWTLGIAFLATSAFVYLLFMLTWLNFASFIGSVFWFRLIIALIAIIGGSINLYSFFKKKSDGCDVVKEEKRIKIFDRIKKITKESKFIFALVGIMVLAAIVNIVELACSTGLPVTFTQVLAMNQLSDIEYLLYTLLYIFFFLIDDIIIFIIAMTTLNVTGISTKYGKISKIIGGIFMILIGLLLLFKPEWIMFNFR